MKKIYYLKSCNTCTRILKILNPPSEFSLQDIKEHPLSVKQLEKLRQLSDSYEALFSKRAKRYKEMGLKDLPLTEKDYRHYILEHYTFLKRPVILIDEQIYIGNSTNTIEAALSAIRKL